VRHHAPVRRELNNDKLQQLRWTGRQPYEASALSGLPRHAQATAPGPTPSTALARHKRLQQKVWGQLERAMVAALHRVLWEGTWRELTRMEPARRAAVSDARWLGLLMS
jgi:hypothetical protein